MSEPLPQLMDKRTIMAELGVTKAAAEAIMRKLPKVDDPDIRKVWVRRSDVERWVRENTRAA